MPSTRPISVALGPIGGDPREALLRLSRLGADGVGGVQLGASQPGLRPRDLDRMARRGLRQRLRQLELRPTGIDLWIPPGHLVDSMQVDRAVDAIRDAVSLAAELDRIGVSLSFPRDTTQPVDDTPPGRDAGRIAATAPPDRPGIVTAESLAAFIAGGHAEPDASGAARRAEALTDVIGALLEDADRHGVDLIDHAVPSRAVGSAGHHRLRVGIDPAAWLAQGEDPAMAVARHAGRIGAVRLCDLTVGGLRAPVADEFVADGSSDRQLDVSAYAAAVSIAAQGIPPIVDARQWTDPWDGIAQSLSVWRRAQR